MKPASNTAPPPNSYQQFYGGHYGDAKRFAKVEQVTVVGHDELCARSQGASQIPFVFNVSAPLFSGLLLNKDCQSLCTPPRVNPRTATLGPDKPNRTPHLSGRTLRNNGSLRLSPNPDGSHLLSLTPRFSSGFGLLSLTPSFSWGFGALHQSEPLQRFLDRVPVSPNCTHVSQT